MFINTVLDSCRPCCARSALPRGRLVVAVALLVLATHQIHAQVTPAVQQAPTFPLGATCVSRFEEVWCFGGNDAQEISYFSVNDPSTIPVVHKIPVSLRAKGMMVSDCGEYVVAARYNTEKAQIECDFMSWAHLTSFGEGDRSPPAWQSMHALTLEGGLPFKLLVTPATCIVTVANNLHIAYAHPFGEWTTVALTLKGGVELRPDAPAVAVADSYFIYGCWLSVNNASYGFCKVSVKKSESGALQFDGSMYQVDHQPPVAVYRSYLIAYLSTANTLHLVNMKLDPTTDVLLATLATNVPTELSNMLVDINGNFWLLGGGVDGVHIPFATPAPQPYFGYSWGHERDGKVLLLVETQKFALVRLSLDNGCTSDVPGTWPMSASDLGQVAFRFEPERLLLREYFICVSFGSCKDNPNVTPQPRPPPGVTLCPGQTTVPDCLTTSIGCCWSPANTCIAAYQDITEVAIFDDYRPWQLAKLAPWTRTASRTHTLVTSASNSTTLTLGQTASTSSTASMTTTADYSESSSGSSTRSAYNFTRTLSTSESRGSSSRSGSGSETHSRGNWTKTATVTLSPRTTTKSNGNESASRSLTLTPPRTLTPNGTKTRNRNSTTQSLSGTRSGTGAKSATGSSSQQQSESLSIGTPSKSESFNLTSDTLTKTPSQSVSRTRSQPRPSPPPSPSLTVAYAAAGAIVAVAVAIVLVCAARMYVLPHWKKRRSAALESSRVALLSTRSAPAADEEPPVSATDALANFTIVRRLMVNNNVSILLATRRIQQPRVHAAPQTSNRGRHLQVNEVPTVLPARPQVQYVVLKMTTCFKDEEKQRALQEFALLQQVALKTKNVTTPYDMFYQAPNAKVAAQTDSGPLRSLREAPPRVTIVMEWYPMGDLESYMKRFRNALLPIPEKTIWVVIHNLATTLAVMHTRCRPAVVHLDVKPSNVLLKRERRRLAEGSDDDDNGNGAAEEHLRACIDSEGYSEAAVSIHLGDFGSARRITTHAVVTGAGENMTPAFGSPECFRDNSHVTAAIDIWALGLTLYNLATLKMPAAVLGYIATTDSDGAAASEIIDGMAQEMSDMGRSPQLVSLMRSMLALRPTDRVAATVVRDLSRAMIPSEEENVCVVAFPPATRPSQLLQEPQEASPLNSARSAEMSDR